MDSKISSSEVIAVATDAGLAKVGISKATKLQLSADVLPKRKERGLHGGMEFTYRNPGRSTDPFQVLPSAKSLISVAYSYGRPEEPSYDELSDKTGYGVVARYAREDSYSCLRSGLSVVVEHLKEVGHKAVAVADSNALVDREVAWRSGLGWYGKNSNLLMPEKGSWFVLGAVVTSADLEPVGEVQSDGCASCTKCIDDCPTGAIVGPGIVDAGKCISWLVQSPKLIPREYRVAVGTRLYGCDDCQEVCPPNQVAMASMPSDQQASGKALVDVFWLLDATNEEILEQFQSWYIPKRNPDFIRRTAIVVLGNSALEKDVRAVTQLQKYLNHENSLLRAHAVWAAKRLSLDDLLIGYEDKDSQVQEELRLDVVPRVQDSE